MEVPIEGLRSSHVTPSVVGDATQFITPILDTKILNERLEKDEILVESFFPSLTEANQEKGIKEEITCYIAWSKEGSVPINKFTEEGYMAQFFPTLFLHGKADFDSNAY